MVKKQVTASNRSNNKKSKRRSKSDLSNITHTALYSAVALAAYTIPVSELLAADVCTGTGPYNFGTTISNNCDLSGTEELTIINTSGALMWDYRTVNVSSDGGVVIYNNGTIEGNGRDLGLSTVGSGIVYSGDQHANGSITNTINGSIAAYGSSNTIAHAAGIYLYGDVAGTITNNGAISATATDAFWAGMAGIGATGNLTGDLTNSGSIEGYAVPLGPIGTARGILFDGAIDGNIMNDGDIDVHALYAFYLSVIGVDVGSVTVNGSISNSGNITAYADGASSAYATGLRVDGTIAGNVTNSGNISAYAEEAEEAGAIGLYAGDVNGTLTNSVNATIRAIATDADSASATGILVGDIHGHLANEGSIVAIASSASSYASATGIRGNDLVSTTSLVNNGTLSVYAGSATTATATGIYLESVNGTLTNNGDIDVSVEDASNAYAYGIYINNDVTMNGTITNNGNISASIEPSSYFGTAFGSAYGIYVGTDIDGTLSNSGNASLSVSFTGYGNLGATSISSATATNNWSHSGTLYGIYAGGSMYGDSALSNSGSIDVSFNGGYDATGTTTLNATNTAEMILGSVGRVNGIYIEGGLYDNASLTSDGNISLSFETENEASANYNLTAVSPSAVAQFSLYGTLSSANGIYVGGLQDNATLTNNGSISIDAILTNDFSGSTSATTNGSSGLAGNYLGSWVDNTVGIYVDGSLDDNASVSNNGPVSLTINIDNYNSGSVDLNTNGSSSIAETFLYGEFDNLYGIYVSSDLNDNSSLSNTGDITIDAAISNDFSGTANLTVNGSNSQALSYLYGEQDYFFGIMVDGGIANNATLTNSANISITSSIDNDASGDLMMDIAGSSAYGSAYLYGNLDYQYGIYVSSSIDNNASFNNSGAISIDQSITNDQSGDRTITTNGSYSGATGYLYGQTYTPYGIYIESSTNDNATVTNSGPISLSSTVQNAQSGTDTLNATGIYADAKSYLYADVSTQYGIYLQGDINDDSSFSNSGALTLDMSISNNLTGTHDLSVGGAYGDAVSYVYGYANSQLGIYINSDINNNASVTNTGNIAITSMIDNDVSGSITIDASGSGSYTGGYAYLYGSIDYNYGIYLAGGTNNNATLSNTGTISIDQSISNDQSGDRTITSNGTYNEALGYLYGLTYTPYGIYVEGDIRDDTSVNNTGPVSVSSTIMNTQSGTDTFNATGTGSIAKSYLYAENYEQYGIYASTGLYDNGSFSNAGDLTIDSYASNNFTGTHNLTASGSSANAWSVIFASATAAVGIDIDGDMNDNASFTNTGNITITSSFDNDASGDITISASGTNAKGYSYLYGTIDYNYGIYLDGSMNNNASLTNSGAIVASNSLTIDLSGDRSITSNGSNSQAIGYLYSLAYTPYGIYINSDINDDATVNNTGPISLTSSIRHIQSGTDTISANGSGSVAKSFLYGEAYQLSGIYVGSGLNQNGSLTNSGDVTIASSITNDFSGAHNLTANGASARVTSYLFASASEMYGLYINSDLYNNASVSNSGAISVTTAVDNNSTGDINLSASGSDADAYAYLYGEIDDLYGIYTGNMFNNGSLSNTGDIVVDASVDNTQSGEVTINASAGDDAYNYLYGDIASIYGIYTQSLEHNSSLSNDGNISVNGRVTQAIDNDVTIDANGTGYVYLYGEMTEALKGLRTGSMIGNSSLANNGNIQGTASIDNRLSGNTTITANTAVGQAYLYGDISSVYGIYTSSLQDNASLTNTGSIDVSGSIDNTSDGMLTINAGSSAYAYLYGEISDVFGIRTWMYSSNNSLTNSGNITASGVVRNTASGQYDLTSTDDYAFLYLYGTVSDVGAITVPTINGELTNTGSLSATAGVYNTLSGPVDLNVTNATNGNDAMVYLYGDVSYAYGLYASGTLEGNSSLSNAGTIDVDVNVQNRASGDMNLTSAGMDGDARIYLYADATDDNYGIYVGSTALEDNSSINSSGSIDVTVTTENTLSGNATLNAGEDAALYLYNDNNELIGLYANWLYDNSSISNSGPINVVADADNTVSGSSVSLTAYDDDAYSYLYGSVSKLYGIYVDVSMNDNSSLSHSGQISVVGSIDNLVTSDVSIETTNGTSGNADGYAYLYGELNYMYGIYSGDLYNNASVTADGDILVNASIDNTQSGEVTINASAGDDALNFLSATISAIYGLYAGTLFNNSSLSNNGNITVNSQVTQAIDNDVTLNANGAGRLYLYGEVTEGFVGLRTGPMHEDSSLTNNGDIQNTASVDNRLSGNTTITTATDTGYAYLYGDVSSVYGIYNAALYTNASLSNTGSIDVSGSVDNTSDGMVTVNADMSAYAYLYGEIDYIDGIQADIYSTNATLSNSGNITASGIIRNTASGQYDLTSTDDHAMLYLYGEIDEVAAVKLGGSSSEVTNTGSLSATAGIYNTLSGPVDLNVTNATNGNDAKVYLYGDVSTVYGLYAPAFLENNSSLANTGSIDVDVDIQNRASGDINLTTAGATGDAWLYLYAEATEYNYGVYTTFLYDDSSINNSGSIDVTVTTENTLSGDIMLAAESDAYLYLYNYDSNLYGIYNTFLYDNSSISNSGQINVIADLDNAVTGNNVSLTSVNDDAYAYLYGSLSYVTGIYTSGLYNNASLSNSGQINVIGSIDNQFSSDLTITTTNATTADDGYAYLYGEINYMYGIYSSNLWNNASLTSDGDILVDASIDNTQLGSVDINTSAGDDAELYLYGTISAIYGIYTGEMFNNSSLTNNGDITVNSRVTQQVNNDVTLDADGNAYVYLYGEVTEGFFGLRTNGLHSDSSLTNNGSIQNTASVDNTLSGNTTVTSATDYGAVYLYGDVDSAYGIYTSGQHTNASLSNSGAIDVYGSVDNTSDGMVTVNADDSAYAYLYGEIEDVYGLYANMYSSNTTLSNSGDITASGIIRNTATGQYDLASANGSAQLYLYGEIDDVAALDIGTYIGGDLTINSSLSATAGIYNTISGPVDLHVTNVTNGNDARLYLYGDVSYAYGLYVGTLSLMGNSSLANAGTIEVDVDIHNQASGDINLTSAGTGGFAGLYLYADATDDNYGIYAWGLEDNSSINNSGSIDVTVTTENALSGDVTLMADEDVGLYLYNSNSEVYGVHVAQWMYDNSSITNTGQINAIADVDNSVTSSSISMTADNDDAYFKLYGSISDLYGLYVSNWLYDNSSISNSGQINAIGNIDNMVSADLDLTVTNGTSGDAHGYAYLYGYADYQYGIYTGWMNDNATLTNDGDVVSGISINNQLTGTTNITVNGANADATVYLYASASSNYGIYTGWIQEGASLTNNGSITALADFDNTASGDINLVAPDAASDAYVYLYGEMEQQYGLSAGWIYGDVSNDGSITVSTTFNNDATGNYDLEAAGFSEDVGLYLYNYLYSQYGVELSDIVNNGSFTNSGTIVTSAVGTSDISGTVDIAATGAGADAQAYIYSEMYEVYGVEAGNIYNNGSLTNSGDIESTIVGRHEMSGTFDINASHASGGSAQAYIYNSATVSDALNVNSIYNNGSLTNSGSISSTADMDSILSGDFTINSGGANARAGAYASATAYGLDTGGIWNNGSLTNSGDITTVATADSVASGNFTITAATSAQVYQYGYAVGSGLYIGSSIFDEASVTNSGDISVMTQARNEASGTFDVDGTFAGLTQTASAYAYGIDTDDIWGNGTVTNSGTVTSVALADNEISNSVDLSGLNNAQVYGFAYGDATGIDTDNIYGNGQLINNGTVAVMADGSHTVSGDITVSADISAAFVSLLGYGYGYGIRTGYIDGNGLLDNNGIINVVGTSTNTVTGSVDVSAGTSAYFYNLASGLAEAVRAGTITSAGSIVNEGTIIADADATNSVSAPITVSGTQAYITHSAYAYGTGIWQQSVGASGELTNNGTVTVTADAVNTISGTHTLDGSSTAEYHTNASADAWGLYVSNAVDGTYTNEGTVTAAANAVNDVTATVNGATSHTGFAYALASGVYAGSVGGSGIVTNNGTITASAFADAGTAATAASASAYAYGLTVNGPMSGTMTNNGTITASATATGGTTQASSAAGVWVGTLDGTLVNNGQITGTVGNMTNPFGYSLFANTGSGSVTNEGTLTGNISLGGSIDLTNNGTINLNPYHDAVIGGNYVQESDGIVNLSIADVATYSSLTANTVDISASNTIGVSVLGYIPDGQDFLDVFVGTTTTGNMTVVSYSPLYTFTALDDGVSIDLTINQTGTLAGSAPIRSAEGVAGALQSIAQNNPTGDLFTLTSSLYTQPTTPALQNAIASLVPTLDGGVSAISAEAVRGLTRAVRARLRQRGGLNSGDSLYKDQNMWLKPYYHNIDQGMRHRVPGYDMDAWGIAFGADADLSNQWRVGAGAAYTRSDFDRDYSANSNSVDADTLQVGIYGDYAIDKNTELKLQAALGWSDYDSKRTIPFLSETAKADFNSTHLRLTADYEMASKWSSSTDVTYKIFGDYTYVDVDGYNEKGAPISGLNVSGDSEDELIIGAGAQWDHHLDDTSLVTLNAELGYDLLADRTKLSSRFLAGGPTFETDGLKPGPIVFRGGVGYSTVNDSDVQINARYDIEARSDYTDQAFSINFRWKF